MKLFNNLKKVVVLLVIFVITLPLNAQSLHPDNIAPQAAVSCSDPWNWENINNETLGNCGTQTAFVWTGNLPPQPANPGVDWMLWEWNQSVRFDKIIIHHANNSGARFLNGGMIQSWSGSNWVTEHIFSDLPLQCSSEVSFDAIETDRLRITGLASDPAGQTSNPNFREIEIIEAELLLPPEAQFYAPDTVYVGSNTMLNATRHIGSWKYDWFVNNNPAATGDGHSSFLFTPQDSGMFTIRLDVSDEETTATETRYIYAKYPDGPPVTNFIANKNLLFMGDSVRFIDLTTQAPNSWFWSVTPETTQIDPDPNFPQQPTHGFSHGYSSGSQNPYITFHYPGIYDVSLTAARDQLDDTELKTEYITVAYQLGVIFPIMETTTDMAGAFTDDGGAGAYGNQDGTFLIQPCADNLYLVFDEFEMECGSDHLRIYDGTNDSTGTPLYGHCSTSGFTGSVDQAGCNASDICLPPDTLFSETGSFYVVYEGGNNTDNFKGFIARWGSSTKFTPPTAEFSAPDMACTGDNVFFENLSTGAGITGYKWDYFGSGIIADETKDGEFQYQQPSTYHPRLIVEDCAGLVDTFQAPIDIVSPAQPQNLNLTADNQSPWTGEDIVTLGVDAQQCLSDFEWNITPSSFSFVDGSDEFSRNPEVIFFQPGCYDVQLIASNNSGSTIVNESCLVNARGYCTPVVGQTSQDIGVSRVILGGIDHTSPVGASPYSNFIEDHSTNLEKGKTYQITIQRHTTSNPMDRAVWIDWNQDGDFVDTLELVAYESNARTSSFTANFTVPGFAQEGSSRLRIGTGFGGSTLNPCGNQFIGEFVDYGVNILPATVTPEITVLGDNPLYLEVFDTYVEQGYSAWSDAYGDLTSEVSVANNIDNTTLGSYTVTYTVFDEDGNGDLKTREVIVQDTEDPTIELTGSDTLTWEVNTNFEDPGVVVSDNYWTDLTPNITANLNIHELGFYLIDYCVTDGSGNGPICVSRVVEIVDTTPPDIEISSDTIETEVLEPVSFEDVHITDNYWGADNIQVEFDGIDETPDELGNYTVTVTATDGSGNTSNATFIVRVVDTTPPVITLNGEPMINIARFHGFQDPWVTVEDNFDPEPDIIVGGSFEGTDNPGMYNITYYAVDQSGNQSQTVERQIFVDPADALDITESYSIAVYPNPANAFFDVKIEGMHPEYTVEVTDLTGRIIMNENGRDVYGNVHRFEMSNFAEGVYLIRISDDERSVVRKVNIAR